MRFRTSSVLTLIALAAPGHLAAQDAKTYELKYELKDGGVEKFKARMSVKTPEVKVDAELALMQTGLAAEGEYGRAEQVVTKVKINADMLGQAQDYDSDTGGDEPALLAKAAKSLMAKRTLKVKGTGEIAETPAEKKGGASPIQSMLGAGNLPFELLRLPEKAVKEGESWENTLIQKRQNAFGVEKTVKLKFQYTLKRVAKQGEEEFATIAIIVTPEMEELPTMMGGKVTKASGKGTASFNITKRQLRSLSYGIKIEGETDMGEGQVQKVEMTQNLNLRAAGIEEEKGTKD